MIARVTERGTDAEFDRVPRHRWFNDMSTTKETCPDTNAAGRSLHRAGNVFALVLVAVGFAFSAPAGACLCACSGVWDVGKVSAEAEIRAAEYVQVFSGFVISTERTKEPVIDPPIFIEEKVLLDPGYWTKSKILVLRIWRGSPSSVTEVWTPITSNCDLQPIPGFYFEALVRSEKGRSVASNSPCDCNEKAAAMKGLGAFTVAGMSVTAAGTLAAATIFLWLVKVIRRRKPSG
jgi:hypothetical protein